ncbi:hydrogenase small subunit [Thiobacillus sp. 65-1402]|uniref:hydrogenase small subunit n=1 Tax=Thiobacillus sp. 65-1402 TaxID=1895861 RepID=UPI000963CE25|nr:hydrogenase small subunit [Thiobacillus sp. 65-1402]OJW94566.1 MAG: Ni/Fe hydrogenase [Thiobacillus sp. 65-1402]
MQGSLIDAFARQGVSRRSFLKYCATLASMMALPPVAGRAMAEAMAAARRPSVIWLPFQECTGCTESITRSHAPTIEGMIFDMISLDYQETLMAAAGHQAEDARLKAMRDNAGKYLLIVDGSIPLGRDGAYSCIGGRSNVEMLKEAAQGAAAVVAVGSCAAFGGIPRANPNPTGAVPVSDIVKDKPIVNIPGCPPIPVVMTGVLAHYLTFGSLPELDAKGRPKAFFGETIHDRCYRRPFYDQGKFAKTFDDEGARNGWCLFELGCKGPVTHNACATAKWNGGTSWPVESGHGCLGCSEPDFWDAGGFYKALSLPADPLGIAGAAAVAGAAVGVGIGFANRAKQGAAKSAHETTTLADLEK